MRFPRRYLLIAAMAGAALFLTGCDIDDINIGNMDKFRQDFHFADAMQPGSTLELETTNGSVEITGWDQNKIEVTGTKYAINKEILDSVKIEFDHSGNNMRIRTVAPSRTRGYGAKYIVKVPSKMILDRIRSSNGSVTVDNIVGSARVNTSNGSIKLHKLTGDATLETSNARVELGLVTGRMRLNTSNGSIDVQDCDGAIDADTSNSRVHVALANPTPNTTVRLSTSNGGIDLELGKFASNPVVANTSNGSITVKLPGSVDARLIASTSNGSITNELMDGAQVSKVSKTRQEMTLGKGGPLIDLSTSNASIHIQHR